MSFTTNSGALRFLAGAMLTIPTLLWWLYTFVAFGFWVSGYDGWGRGGFVLLALLAFGWTLLLSGWWAMFEGRIKVAMLIAAVPFVAAVYAFSRPGTYLNFTMGI